ncbi:MAG TPA: hypothetical protein VJ907_02720 [Halanaerobiales bacterium]|nr:hypothetical protein [Halanaerobiales bacterium]
MDNIFSYWPLLFLIFAIIGRIMRYINKKSQQASNNNKKNIDNIKEVTNQNKKEGNVQNVEYNTFSFDTDDEAVIKDEKTEKYLEKESKKEKESSPKKPKVRKLQKGKKVKLFNKKEDVIRGIIMKEVLDEPISKKRSSK